MMLQIIRISFYQHWRKTPKFYLKLGCCLKSYSFSSDFKRILCLYLQLHLHSIPFVVCHSIEADRINTSQIRITTQCRSAIVVWRSYVCISLTKCCLNYRLQVTDLSHLVKWSNWQLWIIVSGFMHIHKGNI